MHKGNLPLSAAELEQVSDEALVEYYMAGDGAAGDVLCLRYMDRIHKFFRRRTKNHQDQEDLRQETWAEAMKSLNDGHVPRNFKGWIYAIARHVLAKWLKKKVKIESEEVLMERLTELMIYRLQDCPEHSLLESELREIRRQFEESLPPILSAVFRLRYTDGASFEEIGAALGIQEETARVRYHRAIKAFRVWLQKRYPDIYGALTQGASE